MFLYTLLKGTIFSDPDQTNSTIRITQPNTATPSLSGTCLGLALLLVFIVMKIFYFSYRELSHYKFTPAQDDDQEFNLDPGTGILSG